MNVRTRLALFLCGCAALLNLYSTQGILPQLATTFQIDPPHAGLGITATTFAVALCAPLAGVTTARLRRTRVIHAAAWITVAPTLWSAHVASFGAFVLARLAVGVTMPFLFAAAIAYIGETWTGTVVTELTGYFVAGTTVGGFAGRFVTNSIAAAAGWRIALDSLAAVSTLIAALITLSLRTGAPPRPQQPPRPLPLQDATHAPPARRAGNAQPARGFDCAVYATFLVGACVLFSQVTTFTFIGLRLAQPPYSLGTAAIGAIYAVFLPGACVTPAAGRWARSRGPVPLVTAAAVVGTAGTVLTLTEPLVLVLLGLALSACGVFMTQAAANAFITQRAGPRRALAVGIYLACYYLGGTFGTVAPIPARHRFAWPGCAAAILLAQLCAACVARAFWRAEDGEEAVGHPSLYACAHRAATSDHGEGERDRSAAGALTTRS